VIGIRAGRIAWVFAKMAIPRMIPAIPNIKFSFDIICIGYFGL